MEAPSIAEWLNLGGLGLFAGVVYWELKGIRRDLTAFIERLLDERKDVTPIHGVPITGYRQHKRQQTPPKSGQ